MRLIAFIKRIAADRKGATAIEYGLIVSLIVIAMIGSFQMFADSTIAMWSSAENAMSNANSGAV